MIYYSVFIIIALLAFLDLLMPDIILQIIAIILLVIIAGFRSYNVGPDTIKYIDDYHQILWGYSSPFSFEKGFYLIEKLSAIFHLPVYGFFLIVAALTMIFLSISFRKYTSLPLLATLLYFVRFYLNRDLNQIRSGISSAIVLFSINYIYRKKPVKFVLTVLIAGQFHTGAYVMLLTYPIYFLVIKLKSKIIYLYPIILIMASFFSFEIKNLLVQVIDIVGEGSTYITYSDYVQGSGLLNPVLLMQIFVSLTALYVCLKKKQTEKLIYTIIVVYMVSTIVLVLLSQYSVLAGRTSTILATCEPIIIIYLFRSFMSKLGTTFLGIMLAFVIFYVLFISTGQLGLNFEPYYFSLK